MANGGSSSCPFSKSPSHWPDFLFPLRFDFYAIVIFDRKNKVTTRGFSQGISVAPEVMEKVKALTPTEYPFREWGVLKKNQFASFPILGFSV